MTPELGNQILDAVATYGMALPSAQKKYGILGFCWGGGRSFLHAKAPVLGLYGGNDARINATIPATDSAMKRLGKSYEYYIFDGAGHGFLRAQDGNEPNTAAAIQAWPKTIAFLKAKLGA